MGKIIEKETIKERMDESGNIIISSTKNTQKIKAYDEEAFFKLFCNNLGMLKGLKSATTYKILFGILQYATGRWDNNVFLGYGVKTWLCKKLEVHRPNFYKAIKELVRENILIPHQDEKDLFVWNPFFIGQGSLSDIAKLRQTIQIDYDFENLTMETTFKADSVTKTGIEILKDKNNYEVKSVKENNGDSEILLGKKQTTLHN